MPRKATPRPDQVAYAVFNAGCSSWQGPHHDPQKISTTGRPRNAVMLTAFPVSVGPPDAVTCWDGVDVACEAPQPATSNAITQAHATRRLPVTAAEPPCSPPIRRRPRTTGFRGT